MRWWNPERAAYSATYHGRSFFFTSFEHRQRFESDPETYIGRRAARVGPIVSASDGMARDEPHLPLLMPDRIN